MQVTYERLVEHLSEASVRKHFDAYQDIDWSSPEHKIDPNDSRWERQEDDVLGATDWYRSSPQSTRARLGLNLIVHKLKIGLEFERVLKRGLLEFTTVLPDGAPEFRYAYHEVIEEAQHSLMFHEFIRRSGLAATGMTGFVRWSSERVPRLGRTFPERFFIHVLGGEAPIDYVQRTALAREQRMHPLLRRVMQIHVTEEARHLCFAREFLKRNVRKLGFARMLHLRIAVPLILRESARAMLEPPAEIVERYRIPPKVMEEAYSRNPRHRQSVIDGLASVRDLCLEVGVLTRRLLPLWKRLGLTA